MQFWIGASGTTFTTTHPHVHLCTQLLLLLEYMYMYIARLFTSIYLISATMYQSYQSLWLEIQQEDVDRIALPIGKASYQDRTLTATFDIG